MSNAELNKGFTLIELLVVISIISLLSSVALASLSSARAKARNAVVQQEVRQYVEYAKFIRSEQGKYPATGVTAYGFCLGIPSSGSGCGVSGNAPQSPLLNAFFAPYINNIPNPNKWRINLSYYTWHGAIYTCMYGNAERCYTVNITWVLEGKADCGPGTSTWSVNGIDTSCVVRIYDR